MWPLLFVVSDVRAEHSLEVPTTGDQDVVYACRGIVSAHGGTIAVESAGHDRGTTVVVTLPALDDEPGEGEV